MLAALSAGKSIEGAAQEAGVSYNTVARRLKDPRFKAKLAAVQAGMVERAAQALTAASAKAINTLAELIDGAPAPVRLGAARTMLEMAFRARESAELEARLAAVEAKLAKRFGGTFGGRLAGAASVPLPSMPSIPPSPAGPASPPPANPASSNGHAPGTNGQTGNGQAG